MIKKICIIIMCITSIFIISACGGNEEQKSQDEFGDEDITEYSSDMILNDKGNLTLEELKTTLFESNAIELKSINNDTLGVINDRNSIASLVNRILSYEIVDTYVEEQTQNVIGPINIYFDDGTALYGLVKEGYIYIDGYYFLMSRSERNYVVNYLSNKVKDIHTSE